MWISVYNFKGGEGKSKISINLALTMKFAIVTNDVYSPIDDIFSEDKFLKMHPNEEMPDFSLNDNIIFDFGGYPDQRTIKALRKSKVVIVPITNEEDNIQVGIHTIDEIQKYNTNIIIIANKTEKGDFESIKSDLEKIYKYPILEIKKSTAVKRLKYGQSIKEMSKKGLWSFHYSKISEQFDDLIRLIQSK